MESFQMQDGRKLSYRRKGSGPFLVCHPGGPGFSGQEFGELPELARSLTLVLVDPRGTGSSDPPDDPSRYTLDDFAADLDELRDHVGLERMNLLGFSHGGMVAVWYAATRPGHVDRLVLASTLARWGQSQEEESARGIERRRGEPWHGEATAALQAEDAGDYGNVDDASLLWRAMAPMYFSIWDEAASRFIDETSVIGNTESLSLFNAATPDLLSDLGRIEAPTLVITGEDDFVCGPASARELAGGIRDAKLVLLPNAGHFGYYEQPARFAEAVTAFLSSGAKAQ